MSCSIHIFFCIWTQGANSRCSQVITSNWILREFDPKQTSQIQKHYIWPQPFNMNIKTEHLITSSQYKYRYKSFTLSRPNKYRQNVKGLVQDCSNSIANTLELLQTCAKPSMCFYTYAIYLSIYKDSLTSWRSYRYSNKLNPVYPHTPIQWFGWNIFRCGNLHI